MSALEKIQEQFDVRGKLEENAPLGEKGWFKCGGRADLLFKPADVEDLQSFLKHWPEDQPVMVVGGIANTIVRDGGVRGVVIRLGKEFAQITTQGTALSAGTAALNMIVAQTAARDGIAGLEFFSGIPGTVGGALRMNAGSYGSETKNVLQYAEAVDRSGDLHSFTPEQMGMAYRHNDMPADMIFVTAHYEGQADEPDAIRERIAAIRIKRQDSQPIGEKTGGSTFANPSPEQLGAAGLPPETKVWQLIDKVGGRGLMIGGAQMSEKHCNFMINTGTATASDLEALGEEIRRRVREETGVELRWEIRRIGDKP